MNRCRALVVRRCVRCSTARVALLLLLIPVSTKAASRWGDDLRAEWPGLGEEVVVETPGSVYPWIRFEGGRRLESAYLEPDGLWPAAASKLVGTEPRSLASADFDRDGVPDLAVGYRAADGSGYVALHRGNIDAIYPNAPEAQQRRAEDRASSAPFLAPAALILVPAAADFLVAGDLDGDRRADLALAARGGSRLYWLRGDGRGAFGETEAVDLGGRITALAAGEVHRKDRLPDLAVGVEEENGARLLVFQAPGGALTAPPESLPLPAAVTDLTFGRLVGDGALDLAVAAGSELVIVHGRDRLRGERAAAAPTAQRVEMGFAVEAVAFGDFLQDDAWNRDLALLADDGEVHVINLRDVNGDEGWNPTAVLDASGARDGQATAFAFPAALVPLRVSSLQGEQLAILGPGEPVLALKVPGAVSVGVGRLYPVHLEFPTAEPPVAVLPMRLNGDGLDDLVVLQQSTPDPIVVATRAVVEFEVDDTGNAGDANTGDDVCATATGVCTLKAAMQQAEATAGAQLIKFNIGGGGQQTITGHSSVNLTETVTIDGTTQPGYAGTPIIQVQGSSALVTIKGDNSVVRGLALNDINPSGGGCSGNGVTISGGSGLRPDNVIVEGNYIGVGFDGATTPNNGRCGIATSLLGSGNTIGGSVAAARNVVGGFSTKGVEIRGDDNAVDNVVMGNYIGVSAAGTAGIGGGTYGLWDTADGGGSEIEGNVISDWTVGTTSYGIYMDPSSAVTQTSVIQGNFVGTNAAGTTALPNGTYGVYVSSTTGSHTIGGTAAGEGNVIAGNTGTGARLFDNIGHVFRGNYVGTNATGNDLGNGSHGVWTTSENHLIGGVGAGEANIFAFNDGAGVRLEDKQNFVRGNSIHSNSGLGIDNSDLGVTPNDPQPDDVWTNFPVLLLAVDLGSVHRITGSVESDASTTFDLDLYRSAVCDASGHGEGEELLTSTQVTTNASGMVTFSVDLGGLSVADVLTATATRPTGSTSEFSACLSVECPADLVLDRLALAGDESFEATNSITMQDVDVQAGSHNFVAGQLIAVSTFQNAEGANTAFILDPAADCQ